MEKTDLLALFDRQLRAEIEYPNTRKDVLPHVVRFMRPAPRISFVLYSHLDEATADGAIEEQLAYFRGLGWPFEWKVYTHDRPSDLHERLRARGFEVEGPDAVMFLDLSAAPEELLRPPPPAVRRLEHREELSEVKNVLARVWGGSFDWVDAQLGGDMQIPGFLSIYTAAADGETASAGWIYFHPNSIFASLWGGSTLKEHRKRGLYTALLAARVQEARQRGYRYLVIDAGPESRPIVTKRGFQLLTETYDCEWKPDKQG